jgi:PEP-CTERM motif
MHRCLLPVLSGTAPRAIPKAALLCLLSASASAVTLDFEALTALTVVTNQLQPQGVLVSGFNSGACCQPGIVINTTVGHLGVFNFGGSPNQALVYGVAGDQLNFDFVLPNTTTPTTWDQVSLRIGDGDAPEEKFRVTFKGLSGNVLNVQEYITAGGSVNGGVTVSYNGGGVNRIEVLGLVHASGGGVDDLSFSSPVPEPGTWLLMSLGLAGLALRRRSS